MDLPAGYSHPFLPLATNPKLLILTLKNRINICRNFQLTGAARSCGVAILCPPHPLSDKGRIRTWTMKMSYLGVFLERVYNLDIGLEVVDEGPSLSGMIGL